jgi:CheY-like chemotaxis protein
MRTRDRGSEDLITKQAREIIERQVANLTTLVSDLLEVSRVLSGRIHLDRQIVDLNQIVRHAVETSSPLIQQRKHELVVNIDPQTVWVNADATRLEEVLINLLTNSAKYTPDHGRIEIWSEKPASAGIAQFRIRDNGMGVDAELLPRIFDLFTQADRSLARSAGGLGIGLSLAHRLVTMHGGTIDVVSPPPGETVGSEFRVRLPLTSAPANSAKVDGPDDANANRVAPGMRVLIVDDNVDLVMMLTASLRHKGYAVQSAYTGADGLKVALQWRPDIVLLDIGLPILDGYEVARQIRSAPHNELRRARLVAVTGYGREVDKNLAREAGFDGHLVKPVDFDVLEKMIRTSDPMRL